MTTVRWMQELCSQCLEDNLKKSSPKERFGLLVTGRIGYVRIEGMACVRTISLDYYVDTSPAREMRKIAWEFA